MKKILLGMFGFAFAQLANAQLANTSWSGSFYIPEATQMIVAFKSDTLFVNFEDKTTLETMSYKISNDTLSIVKIDGQSPCSISDAATYKISQKDNQLFISAINDSCPERASAWPTDGMKKIE